MDWTPIIVAIISGVLSGGIIGAVVAIYKAPHDNRKTDAEAAKTLSEAWALYVQPTNDRANDQSKTIDKLELKIEKQDKLIDELRKSVDELRKSVDNRDQIIHEQSIKMASQEAEINEMRCLIEAKDAQIAALNTRLNKVEKRQDARIKSGE